MTGQAYELQVEPRVVVGKKTKQLRAQGVLPANIFGDVKESIAVQLNAKEFRKIYNNAGETGLVHLQLGDDKKTHPVLIDEVEINPLTGSYLHVSFRQVNLKEKVTASISVELTGELSVTGATPVLLRDEIEIEALPTDLPESFTIDLGQFTEIDQEFTVAQLDFDRSKVELLEVEPDQVLLQIQAEQQMEEVVEESTEPVEVETTAMGKKDDEEAPEGEAKE